MLKAYCCPYEQVRKQGYLVPTIRVNRQIKNKKINYYEKKKNSQCGVALSE
jgi:hypothetical protein